jgi:hypothetical protein
MRCYGMEWYSTVWYCKNASHVINCIFPITVERISCFRMVLEEYYKSVTRVFQKSGLQKDILTALPEASPPLY